MRQDTESCSSTLEFPYLEEWQTACHRTAMAGLRTCQRLEEERVAAFKEYAEDDRKGRLRQAGHLVELDEVEFPWQRMC